MRLAPPPTLKFTVHTVYWSIIYRYKYWGKNYNISLEVCTEVQYSYLWTFILKRQNAVLLFAFQKLTFRSFRTATIAGKGGNRFRLTITTADHACAGTTMGGGVLVFFKAPDEIKARHPLSRDVCRSFSRIDFSLWLISGWNDTRTACAVCVR